MENSRNLILLLVIIAAISLIAWTIHNGKGAEANKCFKECREYVVKKYEIGKNKVLSFFNKKTNL